MSYRAPITTLKNFSTSNKIVGIVSKIALCDNFVLAHKKAKAIFDDLKKSMPTVYGYYLNLYILVCLPFGLDKKLIQFIADGVTVTYTNVLASKISFVWDGKKTLG